MNEYERFKEHLKADFYDFFLFFWNCISHQDLVESPHIKLIATELQQLSDYIINEKKPPYDWLIINVPPGSSKSSLVSVMFPVWLMTIKNSIFTINTSYSWDLSVDFVRKSRAIFDSEEYVDLFGKQVLKKNAEDFFETSTGGGRYATSTGGTVTGKHANVIIIDDPISSEMSYSAASRDRANRFILETLTTRKRDKEKTPIIMIMQRLHEDDPTGHIVGKDLNVKQICLPAELSVNCTHPEIYTDGLLCPQRMGPAVLATEKKTLGSFGYSGQYGQTPVPDDGGKIKKAWFKYCQNTESPTGNYDIWVDGAYTDKTKNDPTGVLICKKHDNRLFIKYCSSKWFEMPELLKFITDISLRFDCRNVYIEPKASGKTLKQLLLQKTSLNAIEIHSHLTSEGKEARVQAAAPAIESGRVILEAGTWNDEFIGQLAQFPNGKHDEYCDLIGYAVSHYFNKSNNMTIVW